MIYAAHIPQGPEAFDVHAFLDGSRLTFAGVVVEDFRNLSDAAEGRKIALQALRMLTHALERKEG